MKKVSINIIFIFSIVLLVIFFNHVEAGGCSISEFSMNPTDPYTLGTHVKLHVVSNCGTVRFEIDGQPKAEIGSSEQWETWKTEETGSGTHEVCAVGRGDGGWENADRKCRTVYVEGGQAPPSGSQQAEYVRCWVNSFTVTPSSGPKGTKFNFASQGQCDGNMRAARYTIDGSPYGEHSSNTYNTNWNTNNVSTGSHNICYMITGGYWSDAAKSCVTIKVTKSGNESNDVVQGNQTTNNVPGQTVDSNPSLADHPQGDPPAQQSSSSSTTFQSDELIQSSKTNDQACTIGYFDFDMNDIARITPGPANYLRNNPTISANQIGKIPGGEEFYVVGGPKCQDGYWWWKVQYNGQIGWTAQGTNSELWIEKVQASNQYEIIDSDIESSGNSSFFDFLVPQAQASTNFGYDQEAGCEYIRGPINDNEPGTQCVEFVGNFRREDVRCWSAGYATPNQWLKDAQGELAQSLGISVSKDPQIGDMVVWPKNCQGIPVEGGHVGYVLEVNNESILVEEANSEFKGEVHAGNQANVHDIDMCMFFIHQPSDLNASTSPKSSNGNSNSETTETCQTSGQVFNIDNPDTILRSSWILRAYTSYSNLQNGYSIYYKGKDIKDNLGQLNVAGSGEENGTPYVDFWLSGVWAYSNKMTVLENTKPENWTFKFDCP